MRKVFYTVHTKQQTDDFWRKITGVPVVQPDEPLDNEQLDAVASVLLAQTAPGSGWYVMSHKEMTVPGGKRVIIIQAFHTVVREQVILVTEEQ